QISGRGGDDVLLGRRGSDAMDGGTGRDAVLGGNEFGPLSGDKTLDGGKDGDFVGGAYGSDSLAGGGGKDYLTLGPIDDFAQDVASGGGGNDAIFAKNIHADKDIVDCGPGFDRALVDSKDITSRCEREYTKTSRFFRAISPNYFAPLP
ncbi:MAG TPA: hypothetical protein VHM69_07275, partial [Rubrobacter sp.]|nr:hypothetical protein [Rubrobacter sp.]